MNHLALILLLVPASAFAAESSFTLPAIQVLDKPSFETLREESLVPVTVVPIQGARSTLLDDLKWNTLFPLQNLGFPSGANGINLGGRSSDDTQVTSLGVPLNQAIGGGADLSAFPAFLWSEARIAPTTTSAAFIQQSASGNLDLTPWSWSILKSRPEPLSPSRLTMSWDRDLQTLSIGTRKSDISVLAGNTFGRQTGPAGSLSYRFLKTPALSLSANVIGTDQKGESPGPVTSPDPNGKKNTTRVIPSLMAQYGTDREFSVQTTIFGDFQRLQFLGSYQGDPYDSQDKTQSIGIENAIVLDQTILTASARNVRYSNNFLASWSEWPAHFGVTQGVEFKSGAKLKATGSFEYLSSYGFHPGGRISTEIPVQAKETVYVEVQSIPKLPSIQDRLYVTPTFIGNPNVSTERTHAIVAGFEDKGSFIRTKSQIRGEIRRNIILLNGASLENSGSAQFLSFSETASAIPLPFLQLDGEFMASYSKLEKNGNPYPR
ncbi:MAG: hypothetical protein KGP28_04665, partial [Bdellovibrionales bacterium]|nr:hypothetical protein [Bdellovibrionales bacterium]